ncbi:hypothetical protein PIIN_10824 [Serendipita indica DSM 11827]|uniref:Uncharacterized protein n=1 Tax=Serendipita indica (strain DSM 11827) TaxID=1109443 RepID=G4TZU6_SERID|nr:hypothetical protein PIIN_10824 [Serendipita indica DSM 11827]
MVSLYPVNVIAQSNEGRSDLNEEEEDADSNKSDREEQGNAIANITGPIKLLYIASSPEPQI